MNKFLLILITTISGLNIAYNSNNKSDTHITKPQTEKPKIAFTFDDGRTDNMGGYQLKVWNELLLQNLRKHKLKAILFSSGANKTTPLGKYVLSSWNNAGHLIANHTFTHPNFNSKNTSLESFELELTSNDSIIKAYSNYCKYFRFPYLKEGDTKEKVEGFRAFMKQKGYKNGHVTIDASDWYIANRLAKRLNENSKADISGFREYYKKHLFNRALFYDSLAYQLTNRRINHVILLHHNLASALFLDDLIQYFKANGWEVMDADKAYTDKIYETMPTNIPAGESLIWALARQSGKFEKALRYPAEDGEYEKPMMDKLGL
ncbi:polysaccharide deacetylase family protein [Emticicia sp. BO119]|uniref:polysaccharide deacetylase family protein n=1 Tax=Emticicia sp. BO119 TaxID=2757768 RepID=UPI0015F0A739|nr:polysaccharide deacetylase family protein [Emticicia sp. BO119]MBA4851334.1 polysaccharide deacetylase family protein [Emticicia sp. BO119]